MYRVLKNQAISLRKRGYSYNLILRKIPVSKSTLSNWLLDVPYVPNATVRKRVTKNLLRFVLHRTKIRLKHTKAIKKEMRKRISSLSERDLFMFGLGVYLGEGTKTFSLTRVINADPRVIRLAILWFRKIFNVPQNHFILRIFLYPDSDVKKILRYWSRKTQLPMSQFYKVQIDMRKNKSGMKHNKLPYGTAHLGIRSLGKEEFGVQLQRRILSSIDIVFEKFGILR